MFECKKITLKNETEKYGESSEFGLQPGQYTNHHHFLFSGCLGPAATQSYISCLLHRVISEQQPYYTERDTVRVVRLACGQVSTQTTTTLYSATASAQLPLKVTYYFRVSHVRKV